MKEQYCTEFFEKSPIAYSYHRVMLNEQGIPYDYEYLKINKAYEDMMKVTASAVVGKRFKEVVVADWAEEDRWNKVVQDVMMNNKLVSVELFHPLAQKWMRITVFPLRKDIFACIFYDITTEYLQEQEIESFFATNLDLLYVCDTEGNYIKVNKAFEHILGYAIEELVGMNILDLVHGDEIAAINDAMKDLAAQKPIKHLVTRFQCKDGTDRYIEWNAVQHGKYIYAAGRDVTEKRNMEIQLNENNDDLIMLTEILKKKNEALQLLAVTDELTGLFNRHYFYQKIAEEAERSERYNEPLSMIILDLDNFKRINDTWGHLVGDEVLKETAAIVGRIIRKPDILARLGGEEFVILMPETGIHGALRVAEKIRETLDQNTHPVVGRYTASFGVAERIKEETFDSWLQRADEALYRAKKGGRNRVVGSEEQVQLPVASIELHWSKEWESGNKIIDDQHRELIELTNRLIYYSLSNAEFEKVDSQLDVLLQRVEQHFNYENHILFNMGYPDQQRHFIIHKTLLAEASKRKEAYQKKELKLSAFLPFITDDVIIGHIKDEDAKYFPYTRK
ncbi:MAG: ydaM1 [Firmicutes bacterium]|nr:ydaM1 [Bacillota bacterium]